MRNFDRDTIYRDYYPKVLGYLSHHLNQKEDAEDLAQTVFLKVYGNLDAFDETKSSISTWIFNIMRNTLIDHLRKQSLPVENELSEEIASDDEDPDDRLIHEEELRCLADGLERLGELERDLIILHYNKGSTLLDISATLGLSYGQTKRLHAKALDKLAVYMKRCVV